MKSIKFKPMGDNLILELIPPAATTEQGLIIPEQYRVQLPLAFVLAAGPNAECKPGDKVSVNMAMPKPVLLEEGEFLMVSEDKGVFGILIED